MQKTPNTIDMQDMRYLNIFSKITGVNTRVFFRYNQILFFVVPKIFLNKTLGKDSSNLRKIGDIIGKRVRILPEPKSEKDAPEFIKKIIHPLEFNDLEITEQEFILNAGRKNKALLFGREKRRLMEMKNVVKKFFHKDFRIV